MYVYRTCHRKAFCYYLYIVWNIIPPENGDFQFRVKSRTLPKTNKCVLIDCQLCNCFFVLNITKKNPLFQIRGVTAIHKCLLDVSASYIAFTCQPVNGFFINAFLWRGVAREYVTEEYVH